jgi:hypothetical protein
MSGGRPPSGGPHRGGGGFRGGRGRAEECGEGRGGGRSERAPETLSSTLIFRLPWILQASGILVSSNHVIRTTTRQKRLTLVLGVDTWILVAAEAAAGEKAAAACAFSEDQFFYYCAGGCYHPRNCDSRLQEEVHQEEQGRSRKGV